uniref:Uncharacterized protein n=1 Tax=Arundo donax TaxID=35708 RepID=A0A0A8Z1J7_ARUDO
MASFGYTTSRSQLSPIMTQFSRQPSGKPSSRCRARSCTRARPSTRNPMGRQRPSTK